MKISIHTPLFCNEIGQRENNEDSIYPKPYMATEATNLFLVCDGMGGHQKGEVASETTAQAISDYWIINNEQADTADKLQEAIFSAMNKMQSLEEDTTKEKKMGTTLTLLSISHESIFVAHVGDSRIYQFRPGQGNVYRSKDHSLVQKWIDAGLITEEDGRTHPKKNVITQVIQSTPSESLQPEIAILRDLKDGDCFFLCTDGVTESWTDEALTDIFNSTDDNDARMRQVKSLCQEQSRDNYSAYLIPIIIEDEFKDEISFKDIDRELLSEEDKQDIYFSNVERRVNEALADKEKEKSEDKDVSDKIHYLKALIDKCLLLINQLLNRKEK